MSRLWILGASDPEMTAIEQLLHAAGEQYEYAMSGGQRVHPGNAYQMTRRCVVGHDGAEAGDCDCGKGVIAVECDTPGGVGAAVERYVDHHRPGNQGMGSLPPNF